MRFASVIALFAACGVVAAVEAATIQSVTSTPETVLSPPSSAHAGVNACSPLDTITVDRFAPVVTTATNEIEVAIHVDGELIGTETMRLEEIPAGPVRLEILRFQPELRQQLITRAGRGAVIEARSWSLTPESVLLTPEQPPAIATGPPTAQIVRSMWKAGSGFARGLRPAPGVQPAETELDSLLRVSAGSCFFQCEEERLLCEEQRCDFSPCAGCDAWYDDCIDRCPCDGIDPILVDEYSVTDEIAVSGRLAVICAGNIFSPYNKTYYDRYQLVDRTWTYRVWRDCHGDETTELVSTVDSAPYICHIYTGQICSPTGGVPPFCVRN